MALGYQFQVTLRKGLSGLVMNIALIWATFCDSDRKMAADDTIPPVDVLRDRAISESRSGHHLTHSRRLGRANFNNQASVGRQKPMGVTDDRAVAA